jgi:hypothetical protein
MPISRPSATTGSARRCPVSIRFAIVATSVSGAVTSTGAVIAVVTGSSVRRPARRPSDSLKTPTMCPLSSTTGTVAKPFSVRTVTASRTVLPVSTLNTGRLMMSRARMAELLATRSVPPGLP